MNNIYHVTFGQQYRQEVHETAPYVHPDGYVTIEAPDMFAARAIAFEHFDRCWAMIYEQKEFKDAYFPRGELCRIIAPEKGSTP